MGGATLPKSTPDTIMDTFKRDNFQRLYPGRAFPSVEVMNPSACDEVRKEIAIRLGGGLAQTGADLVRDISGEAEPVPDVDAKHGFDMLETLDRLGLDHAEYAFLNWRQFEELERIRLRDLSEYFSDIWYPDSDDLDVIDINCTWILSVRHDGLVSLLRLQWDRCKSRSRNCG